MKSRYLIFILFFFFSLPALSQRYLADYDSTLFFRDTLRPFLKRMENLNFSGYIQPQFQVAQTKGSKSFNGGDFQENSNNRFMLRRARVKIDYLLKSRDNISPKALFTFQFEATERDVNVRDMYVRVFEPRKQNLSLIMGLVARPFGYEVNLSSSYRESPERGRASQILMPSERDLGAMITYEPQTKEKGVPVKFDIGMFNGQGKSGPAEFDSFKDLITRFYVKPSALSKNVLLSGGLSFLWGGWVQATKYEYTMGSEAGNKVFVVDSSVTNIGKKAPRQYYGGDLQLVFKHNMGKTELRGEYWRGTQPGTSTSLNNPGVLPTTPTYIRDFNTAFFYFLQNLVNEKWEFIAKYDWFDPNNKVTEGEIGKPATNLTAADIKYHTLGFGLTRYFTGNLKFVAYYDIVKNEITQLPGYTTDLKDNIFTFRMQLRF
jgi:hypothetical protein